MEWACEHDSHTCVEEMPPCYEMWVKHVDQPLQPQFLFAWPTREQAEEYRDHQLTHVFEKMANGEHVDLIYAFIRCSTEPEYSICVHTVAGECDCGEEGCDGKKYIAEPLRTCYTEAEAVHMCRLFEAQYRKWGLPGLIGVHEHRFPNFMTTHGDPYADVCPWCMAQICTVHSSDTETDDTPTKMMFAIGAFAKKYMNARARIRYAANMVLGTRGNYNVSIRGCAMMLEIALSRAHEYAAVHGIYADEMSDSLLE